MRMTRLLGVIHFQQISNWNKLKSVSNWVNAILIDSDEQINLDQLGFPFETKALNDLSNFTFSLLNEKGKKVPLLASESRY